ncbi:hypothetical protein pipiens_000665, partial [Culex pipiens pipiens]
MRTFLAVTLLATLASAQLSFHNDASQNSFQIRTPGFQQSFTRYFNGQQGHLLAAQQQQPQTAQSPQYAVSFFFFFLPNFKITNRLYEKVWN